jgi:hypothetical protein
VNYQEHPDYLNLTERVLDGLIEKELDPQGIKIDTVVSEDELHKYDPMLVTFVAMEQGFDVDVCTYGPRCYAHTKPNIRANGVWLEMPEEIEEKHAGLGTYEHLGDLTMCNTCGDYLMGLAARMKSVREEEPERKVLRGTSVNRQDLI